ncbi:hypothetical protein [Actinomadura nitritigenes]|uniref:hypothetical protein n=1 Tax=Actinomadura nitritigenes TaxID=134602 RepID=UPI003D8C30CE
MGTRGFIGFVADGEEKIAYNQFDSYPSGVGVTVMEWLRSGSTPHLREQVKALRVVPDDSEPTPEDIQRLSEFADLRVSDKDPREWYVLLRDTQGDPGAILRAGVIEDASGFPLDSLFCEWGYLIDLDAETFEVYRGFQHQPHDKGRFASRGGEQYANAGLPHGYYPVALAKSWPLAELPTPEQFLDALGEGEEE